MSDYTITTNFGAKDSLPSGNAGKVIKGSEFTTEFTNIQTAIATKADTAGDTFTGVVNFSADVAVNTNTLFVDVSEAKVGIGTNSPSALLHLKSASAPTLKIDDSDSTLALELAQDGANGSMLLKSAGTLSIGVTNNSASDTVSFQTQSTERMRIDSSGRLLIGGTQVQSPSSIDNGIFIQSQTNNEVVGVNLYTNEASNNRRADFFLDDANGVYGMHSTASTGLADFVIRSSSDERFRVTSSGNVGIGTTSPAFDSGYSGLHISQTAPSIHLTPTGSGTTASDGYAINVNSSGIVRHINKENQPIEFHTNNTERLRIDSAGKVGIGTSSPIRALDVRGGAADVVANFESSDTGGLISLQDNTTSSDTAVLVGAMGDDLRIDTGDTESLRIKADGKVGIGTSSPDSALEVEGSVNGSHEVHIQNTFDDNDNTGDNPSSRLRLSAASNNGYIECHGAPQDAASNHRVDIGSTAASSFLTFSPNSTERMRIDASGNVLVGKTGLGQGVEGVEARADGLIVATRDGGNAGVFNRKTSDGGVVELRKNNVTVGSISVTGSATSYNTSSDERLKENIADSADAGSKIDAIQIKQFDWKADGSHQDYGVIAQELVTVAPEAVHQPEDSEEMMGVDYSKLVPMLIKEVQSLRSRVAELENV